MQDRARVSIQQKDQPDGAGIDGSIVSSLSIAMDTKRSDADTQEKLVERLRQGLIIPESVSSWPIGWEQAAYLTGLVLDHPTADNPLRTIAKPVVSDTAHIMTDQHAAYTGLDKHFASHDVLDHAKEYVRGIIHTNFAESYHSLLKRGIFGTFHHVRLREAFAALSAGV